jgi:hypothetical protein
MKTVDDFLVNWSFQFKDKKMNRSKTNRDWLKACEKIIKKHLTKRITIICLFLLVFLSGCATYYWKEDMSTFDRDVFECEAMSRRTFMDGRQLVTIINVRDMRNCMYYRGYIIVKQK